MTDIRWHELEVLGDYIDSDHAEATNEAWDRWRQASCAEWNGGHLWSLTIDCGSASLSCSGGCGAEPYPDYTDALVGEFPVRVNVREERIRNYEYPDEWDVWVEVEPS